MHDRSTFRHTRAAIEGGIRDRLHTGAQLFVSQNSQTLIDTAFGESRPGVPMKPDFLTPWLSAGKPITAAAIAVLVEQGRINWTTPVSEVIPRFGTHGKAGITLEQVLMHTAGLHVADDIQWLSWEERIGLICDAALPEGWVPGHCAAYSRGAGWHLLGEVVQVLTGETLNQFVIRNVCQPFGMSETRLCIGLEELAEVRDRATWMYDTTGGVPPSDNWNSDQELQRCSPGGSARGPARELGRFYEALLRGGAPVLKAATVQAMTTRHRVGLFDQTFQYRMDWGYGFILNSNHDGFQMPYGYGREASKDTFGHSGSQSSCAFADPENMLAVAWVTNGMPGERRHQQRQRAINNAIYQDLAGA